MAGASYFVTNAISKTQLNMYFKTKNVTIDSAQIVFTQQNTSMQTFYDLLVFNVYFNCSKVEGHHLPPPMKNDPHANFTFWLV